jgi:hypothetical protein
MTAHAGAALSDVVIFGAAAPCPTAILRHENCDSDRALWLARQLREKFVPLAIAWPPWARAWERKAPIHSIYALLAEISPAATMTLFVSNNE